MQPNNVKRIYELKTASFFALLGLEGKRIEVLEARSGTIFIQTSEDPSAESMKETINSVFEEIKKDIKR